jgi:predicted ATPase
MRTLERITVEGYKSIRELRDFELGDLNVLIGANGAGKSNFLSVFKMLRALATKRLQLFVGQSGGSDFLLHFGQKVTQKLKISLALKDSSTSSDVNYDYEFTLIPSLPNKLIFFNEKLDNNLNPSLLGFGSGNDESVLHQTDRWQSVNWEKVFTGKEGSSPNFGELLGNSLQQGTFLRDLKEWIVYHFQDTTDSARVKRNPDIHDNHELKSDAENLASFLYLLKNHYQVYYSRILSTVKLAAPFIEDFVLNPMPENTQRIRLRWQHKNFEDEFDISQLSDGTLRFICLTTLLLQPNPPKLIIIDEPELGLHPYAINVLAGMLRSVSTQTQIIVSTQSVSLVNEFQPEDIIVVDREDDASTFTRLNPEELAVWLEDYKLGELWETNLIGGRP